MFSAGDVIFLTSRYDVVFDFVNFGEGSETVKEGEEGKGRERRVWGWALALSVSGMRTHLNIPSFGNGSTPLTEIDLTRNTFSPKCTNVIWRSGSARTRWGGAAEGVGREERGGGRKYGRDGMKGMDSRSKRGLHTHISFQKSAPIWIVVHAVK